MLQTDFARERLNPVCTLFSFCLFVGLLLVGELLLFIGWLVGWVEGEMDVRLAVTVETLSHVKTENKQTTTTNGTTQQHPTTRTTTTNPHHLQHKTPQSRTTGAPGPAAPDQFPPSLPCGGHAGMYMCGSACIFIYRDTIHRYDCVIVCMCQWVGMYLHICTLFVEMIVCVSCFVGLVFSTE
jgi:hypothetical protein